ncbi:MAG: serine/threonine protein kinase [Pirellulaceae bacterium]|nr:serine/threonine protein kinase [Pirellulaceae bacterium]
MAKSRIGPFALEAPLAPPTKSGQWFRSIHVEQSKLAALRVFSIPLGMTPESRQLFADQIERLKGLRHPGIARCYGGGFDTRRAFLAYELIDGQSLEQLLCRRGRLSWEMAADFAAQIGQALEYAGQQGWTHGRLQPTKIMITGESHIKLLDWRRPEIATFLGSPPTLEQLQCTAPELLDGGQPTEKSDLYSQGAILYWMLTGAPPVVAEDSQQFLKQVGQATIPSVASQVLDCPIWLSAIVEQLLDKSPEQRPFSTTAFLMALQEAQRRQSEGVGVLQHATAGFSPLKLNVDRREAEKLLGIASDDQPAGARRSPLESPWLLLAGLLLAVSAVVWFLLPPSERSLYHSAQKLLASPEWIDWNQARDSYLSQLIQRYPDGQYRQWAEEKIDWVSAREAERRMERDERLGRQEDWTLAQVKYAEARRFERFGDYATAREKYQVLHKRFAGQADAHSMLLLAAEGLDRLDKSSNSQPLHELLTKKLQEADQAAADGRVTEARSTWQAIVGLYAGNQSLAQQVQQAQSRLDGLTSQR